MAASIAAQTMVDTDMLVRQEHVNNINAHDNKIEVHNNVSFKNVKLLEENYYKLELWGDYLSEYESKDNYESDNYSSVKAEMIKKAMQACDKCTISVAKILSNIKCESQGFRARQRRRSE